MQRNFVYDEAARTLRISGGEFAPVEPAVYEFEVSGLKVVRSWLKYRMQRGGGRKPESVITSVASGQV